MNKANYWLYSYMFSTYTVSLFPCLHSHTSEKNNNISGLIQLKIIYKQILNLRYKVKKYNVKFKIQVAIQSSVCNF